MEINMKSYIKYFFERFEYPCEARVALFDAYDKIYENKETAELFSEIIATYESDINCSREEIVCKSQAVSDKSGVHQYTVSLLMYICLSRGLKAYYEEKGVSEEIWHSSMLDLRYNLQQCMIVKNIYGVFSTWFWKFFDMTRFGLGRMHYEITSFKYNYEKDGKKLNKGDKVINIHIPRSLTPFDKESREKSYAMAKEFFKDEFTDTPMAFVCSSYLLYKGHYDFLSEKSNIKSFMNDFDIIANNQDEEGHYPNMWRIFGMDYTGNVDDYPEDTSIRRGYKEFIKNGGRTGGGYGVFFA